MRSRVVHGLVLFEEIDHAIDVFRFGGLGSCGSDEEKRANRGLAKERIVAEHGIGKMKIWRITADRYRNPPRRHTVMMKNVAGLHNRMYG